MAIVSITPGMAGSGFPMGLMPGAFPSDHASRQTLNITAMRLLFGQSQLTFLILCSPPGLYDRFHGACLRVDVWACALSPGGPVLRLRAAAFTASMICG